MMNASKHHTIDHSPISKVSILFFIIFLFILVLILLQHEQQYQKEQELETIQTITETKYLQFAKWDNIILTMQKKGFKAWQLSKVSNFFKYLTPIILKKTFKKGAPPGAILAIAALESGYGTGYIANVSGNILSLNARKTEPMLPPLTLAITKNDKIIINGEKIKSMLAAGYPFKVIKRPPSYKKDYRPDHIAGKKTHLDYFLHHPNKKYQAWEQNVNDLMFSRVVSDSSIVAYKETSKFCDRLYARKSLRHIFSNKSATKFLTLVGGRPISYNIRTSWRDKSISLLSKLNLELFLEIYIKNYKEYYDLSEWKWDINEHNH